MEDKNLPAVRQKTFEELKQVNQYGAEYWSARNLQPLLGYNQWRSFDNAIIKAIVSCEQSGNTPEYHFARARKPIVGGKGAVQEVVDYHLSRFACYLIAQNGDPRKPKIANALCKRLAPECRYRGLSKTAFSPEFSYKHNAVYEFFENAFWAKN
jgi:DNA-damage-inducible protein D